jgi:hypothetical protein
MVWSFLQKVKIVQHVPGYHHHHMHGPNNGFRCSYKVSVQMCTLWHHSARHRQDVLLSCYKLCGNVYWRGMSKCHIEHNITRENQEISIFMIRTTRTRFKTFLEVKERIPDKD